MPADDDYFTKKFPFRCTEMIELEKGKLGIEMGQDRVADYSGIF